MGFWGKIGIPEKKGEATPTLLASSGLVMKPFSESTRVYEYGGRFLVLVGVHHFLEHPHINTKGLTKTDSVFFCSSQAHTVRSGCEVQPKGAAVKGAGSAPPHPRPTPDEQFALLYFIVETWASILLQPSPCICLPTSFSNLQPTNSKPPMNGVVSPSRQKQTHSHVEVPFFGGRAVCPIDETFSKLPKSLHINCRGSPKKPFKIGPTVHVFCSLKLHLLQFESTSCAMKVDIHLPSGDGYSVELSPAS